MLLRGIQNLGWRPVPCTSPFPVGRRAPAALVVNDWRRWLEDEDPSVELSSYILLAVRAFFLVRIFTYYWLSWFYIWFIDIFSLFLIVLKIQRKYIYIYRLFGRYFPANIILLNELLVCVNLIFLHRDNVRGFISVKREREREIQWISTILYI